MRSPKGLNSRQPSGQEPPPFGAVAQGSDAKKSQTVADLSQGRDESRLRFRDLQIEGDRRQERLVVIEIGDHHTAGHRQEKHQ